MNVEPGYQVTLRFPSGDEVLKQAIVLKDNTVAYVMQYDATVWVQLLLIFILLVMLLTSLRYAFYSWRRWRQRKGKGMLSKKGMRAMIRVKVARAITDIVEEDRFRGRISDEAATEVYREYGLNLKMSSLLPRRPTQAELKEIIRNRLGRHAIPLFPDEIEVQSPENLIERYLGGVRNIRTYVVHRASLVRSTET